MMNAYKASKSFAGRISMKKGETRLLESSSDLAALLKCGYVELIEDNNADEGGGRGGKAKRNNVGRRKKRTAD